MREKEKERKEREEERGRERANMEREYSLMNDWIQTAFTLNINPTGIYTDKEGYQYMVCEYMSHGSLQSLVQDQGNDLSDIQLMQM